MTLGIIQLVGAAMLLWQASTISKISLIVTAYRSTGTAFFLVACCMIVSGVFAILRKVKDKPKHYVACFTANIVAVLACLSSGGTGDLGNVWLPACAVLSIVYIIRFVQMKKAAERA